jgi:hypothetical protein
MLDLETTSSATTEDVPSIEIVYDVTNSLSLVGQFFIIITYFSIRKRSSGFYAYVACHSFIELPWLITDYLTIYYATSNSGACFAVAFINCFSYVASMIWSSVIAGVIFTSLKNKQKIPELKWYYPLIAYGVAFIFIIYALARDGFGPYAGSGIEYCWFDSQSSISGYWVPFILTTGFDLYCYIRSIILVKTQSSMGASKEFWGLLMFPLIQIICNLGGIVKVIVDSFGNLSYSTNAEYIPVILAKSQGLLESLAYILNKNVRGEIWKVWCKGRQKPTAGVELEKQMTINSSFNMESLQTERAQRLGPLIL